MTEGRKFGFREYGKVFNWTEKTMIVGLGIFCWYISRTNFS